MRHVLVIAFVALFCAVTAPVLAWGQTAASIPASTPYKFSEVTFLSPNEAGWTGLVSNGTEITLEKRGKDAMSNAGVKTLKTKLFEAEPERLAGWEALKNEMLQALKLKKDSLHFHNVRFKRQPCVQYDASFPLDAASPVKFARYNIYGYLCPLPEANDMVLQLEFANYSNTKGFTEAQLTVREDFFENIVLPKTPGK